MNTSLVALAAITAILVGTLVVLLGFDALVRLLWPVDEDAERPNADLSGDEW